MRAQAGEFFVDGAAVREDRDLLGQALGIYRDVQFCQTLVQARLILVGQRRRELCQLSGEPVQDVEVRCEIGLQTLAFPRTCGGDLVEGFGQSFCQQFGQRVHILVGRLFPEHTG